MAIFDPFAPKKLTTLSSAAKATIALMPGVTVTGVSAIFSHSFVQGAAPLFAIGALGSAAIIMGFFVRAARR